MYRTFNFVPHIAAILGKPAHFDVWLYSNLSVVASAARIDKLKQQLTFISSGVPPVTTTTQPTALSGAVGYVIPATRGSYYEVERLAANRGKLSALSEFVRSGSALVLLDGFQGNATANNSFLPLLSALLGADPRCRAAGVATTMLLQKRSTAPEFIELENTIEVQPRLGLSTLSCQTGQAIYSAFVDRQEVSTAVVWTLDGGAIYWIGSSFFKPNLRGFYDPPAHSQPGRARLRRHGAGATPAALAKTPGREGRMGLAPA
ncbi:hypothetical protein PLESTB_001787100 [Pleodorina starrii]|uniref:Uncharacterized protein n=1 Tax=Pleodorina starrii TaxID=330485 RepID=A0A9W6C0J4_9CHLO|nr:hypothetical protein PLESTB_001787100 [Pleodorina starrii]